MLILLYLMEKSILTKPILYISYYLKQKQFEYYERMSIVRTTGDYEQWIVFFLKAILVSSKDAIETIEKLLCLQKKSMDTINLSNYSHHDKESLCKFLNYIEKYPILTISKTASDLKLSFNTISTIISKLQYLNILKQTNQNLRNKTYLYKEYIDLLKRDVE